MRNDNQDLLDLCRLNLMEENIKDSPAVDRDETMKAIDWKKRQLITKIKPVSAAKDVMDRHRKENNNIYKQLEGDTNASRDEGTSGS